MLVIFLPIALLEYVLLQRMETTSLIINNLEATTANLDYIMGMFGHMMIQELLLYAVGIFLQPVGTIAIAKVVKQYLDGEKPEPMKAIADAFSHMPAIIITGIIYGVLVVLGCIVIVPGIYFGIAWGLYYYCICFEDKKGWDALRGSKALVQGKWWRTFGYLFLLSCVAMLWNSVFELVCSFFGDNMIGDLTYQVLSYISVGFVAVGETLLYLNRKAVTGGMHTFADAVVPDASAAGDMPAEPVEGTVDGAEDEKTEDPVEGTEEKEDENKEE